MVFRARTEARGLPFVQQRESEKRSTVRKTVEIVSSIEVAVKDSRKGSAGVGRREENVTAQELWKRVPQSGTCRAEAPVANRP